MSRHFFSSLWKERRKQVEIGSQKSEKLSDNVLATASCRMKKASSEFVK